MNATVLKTIYDGLLNLIYEPECPFDIESTCSLKGTCSADGWVNKVCALCFNELVDLELNPRRDPSGFTIHSAAEYKNEARTIIQKMKWSNPKLARPISELMNFKLNNISSMNPYWDFIVPVPGIIQEERNWIPSLLLGKELSVLTKTALIEPLAKVKETKLFKLGKEQRQETVKDAYAVNGENSQALKALKEKEAAKVLLVDDLIASGVTLHTCAKLLKEINPNCEITAVTFASVSSDN